MGYNWLHLGRLSELWARDPEFSPLPRRNLPNVIQNVRLLNSWDFTRREPGGPEFCPLNGQIEGCTENHKGPRGLGPHHVPQRSGIWCRTYHSFSLLAEGSRSQRAFGSHRYNCRAISAFRLCGITQHLQAVNSAGDGNHLEVALLVVSWVSAGMSAPFWVPRW